MSTAMHMRDVARRGFGKLRSWLHDASWTIGRCAYENHMRAAEAADWPDRDLQPAELSAGRDQSAPDAVLLQFPVRGEALLVRLAELLRNRVAVRELGCDLLISRCPEYRLSIDHSAYVEFRADQCIYCVAIEARPGTRVTVETAEFDTVVEFVAQYVAARLSEKVLLEAAS